VNTTWCTLVAVAVVHVAVPALRHQAVTDPVHIPDPVAFGVGVTLR